MSMYRVEWECCGGVSETDAYEPDECPFCNAIHSGEITRLRAEAEALRKALAAIVDRDFTFFDGCVDRNTITYGEIQQARAAIDATKGTT